MTSPVPTAPTRWLPALLHSAGMARAFTLAAFAAVLSANAIQWLAGTVTYVTIIVGLCVIGVGMLVARRQEIRFLHLVPISLILFVGWCAISVFWSASPSDTVIGTISQVGIALLAIVVGHVRDTLQTARALGDVMRWLLSISLGLEIVVGILMPHPLHLFGIDGNIAQFGPIEGIFGSRNMLGFVAVLALVTFFIEWRSASVSPRLAGFSVVVAGLLAVFSRSPVVLVLAAAVGLAAGALTLVRRVRPRDRAPVQWVLGVIVLLGVIAAYLLRHQIIRAAGSEFSIRANLWRVLAPYVRTYPVQGWGWFGPWPLEQYPFQSINYSIDRSYTTSLNGYADLLLQVGWVGVVLFAALAGVALVRSWLVASQRGSIVYAWVPMILVTILTNSVFESVALFGAGWMILVVCAVRAGQTRSWRERLASPEPDEGLPHRT
ncbi:lipid A core--O-antigen ligase [Microbacterium mangrovi]|uniref:Lipid A core--O-antigen ligase n=1 Tax=Microbacterium mangrovi TaxID=1348253 RepID=A0A0B2A8M0_9MICO|nr:O-antigen ligase family protein [Microbacterium mangrovi]KHK99455.1 lipid A core--O-antigen ligase [Microbacterium mangrovi]